MKKIFLIFLITFIVKLYSFGQSPDWLMIPNNIHFTTNSITVNSATTTLPANNFPATYLSSNCTYDNAGNILFYIVDGGIFNKLGLLVGNLSQNGSDNVFKNTLVIPDPNDCNSHLILYTTSNTNTNIPSSVNTFIQCAKVTHTPNNLTILQNHYTINSLNNNAFFTAQARIPFTVSKPRPDNSRFLYIADDHNFYKYLIDGSGISLSNSASIEDPTHGPPPPNCPTDLELSPSGNQLAFSNSSFIFDSVIKWVDLDSNGDFSTQQYSSCLFFTHDTYGLEFISDNQIIVTGETLMIGGNVVGGVFVINLTPNGSKVTVSTDLSFAKSGLEKALNGKIYAASTTNGLMAINTTPPFSTSITSIVINNTSLVGVELPKQLDGENYNTIFSCGCQSNTTITGTYTTPLTQSSTWIQSSNTTIIPTGSTVKLDATPTVGYVLLNPGFEAQTGSVFIAQALDGCGALVPMRTAQSPSEQDGVTTSTTQVHQTDIKIFPNPMTDYLTIQHPATIKSISLVDVYGRVLESIMVDESTQTELSTRNLSQGIYFVSIDGQILQKVIKQ